MLMWVAPSSADQLNYSREESGDFYRFNYQWLDRNEQEQSLSFVLTKEALFTRFRNFKAYKPKFAAQFIAKRIQKKLKEQPIPNVQVHFQHQSGEIKINLKSRNPKDLQTAERKIAAMELELSAQYLADNFYQRFTTYNNLKGIKPDHTKIAEFSADDLKSLKEPILENVSIKNIRKVTDFTLGFIQSIPYATLESRLSAPGAGFSTPLKLLWENQGDCDSKVTLLGAMLRALMPRIKMIFVFIDQHALIGIEVPPRAGETTLVVDNATYVIAEPTGPAMLPLGQVSVESEQAILHQHYVAESFF